MFTAERKIVKIPLKDLIQDPANARKHDDKNIAAIKGSLVKFGQQHPIIVDEKNIVLAGNGRVTAAKILGWESMDCIVTDLQGQTMKSAFAIADNRTGELAEWDDEILKSTLEALLNDGFEVEEIGFDISDIPGTGLGLKGDDSEDEVPEVKDNELGVKIGEIWKLGNHRLMCGDSTKIEDILKLMDGEKADITFTSPPYNVGKTPNGNDKKYLNDTDNKDAASFTLFLDSFVNNCLTVSDYVFSNIQSLAGNKLAIIEHMYNMREFFADTMIWDKGSAEPAMARRVLNSQFEYVHIFSKEAKRTIGKKDFRGTISNIFTLNSRADKEFANVHKATFRVELPEMFLKQFTEYSCLDPFCGTGTTLIACEKTNRKCYGMEIEPHYCSVIIKRWEEYTGKKAVLEENHGSK